MSTLLKLNAIEKVTFVWILSMATILISHLVFFQGNTVLFHTEFFQICVHLVHTSTNLVHQHAAHPSTPPGLLVHP